MPAYLITDPDCGFCQRTATWMERRANGAWRNQPADPLVLARAGITQVEASASVWFVEIEQESVLLKASGAKAVAHALEKQGGVWKAAVLLRVPPISYLANTVYKLIARNRHRLPGGTPNCEVPAPLPERE